MADVRIIDLTQGTMGDSHSFESDDGSSSYQISATSIKSYCQAGLTPQSIGIPAGVTTTELGYLDGVTSGIQGQIDAKAPIASPTFTGTVAGVTKAMVGLNLADNTSDANKPISNATQTALNAKQDTLVSATNIKTINSQSLLGSGDIAISGGGVTVHSGLTGLGSDDHTQYSLANGTRWTATPTANRVVVSDSSGNVVVSTVTTTLLSYLSNVSSDIQTQINSRAPTASPTFTGTVAGITKAMVGLSAVEDTALSTWTGSSSIVTLGTIATGIWNGTAIGDTYISSASTWNAKQNALGFTAENVANKSTSLTSPDNTKYPTTQAVSSALGSKQDTLVSGTNIKTINTQSLIGTGDITISGGSSSWGGITGTLSSQTDLQTTLNLKAPLANPTFTGTVAGITKAMVGLSAVEDTALSTWTGSSSITALGTIATGIWNGTAIGDTYISSAGTWNAKQNALGFTPENISNKATNLTSPDNTKYPTTQAVSTAISGFAPLASPTFTGTVNGITKSMVGLGNVDNTTDLNKPISTATQASLDLKNKIITSGTAAPSGGSDGDIYLQYT